MDKKPEYIEGSSGGGAYKDSWTAYTAINCEDMTDEEVKEDIKRAFGLIDFFLAPYMADFRRREDGTVTFTIKSPFLD